MVLVKKVRGDYISQYSVAENRENLNENNTSEEIEIDDLKTEFKPICLENMGDAVDHDPLQMLLPSLLNIRNTISSYQDSRGVARVDQVNFISMLHQVGEHLYNIMIVMGSMFTNLLPIADIFILMFRFIIDKLIQIVEASGNDRIMKALVFLVEFFTIMFVLMFIFGFILSPLVAMVFMFSNKFWRFLYG